jgi:hypothetical protein
LGGKEEVGKVVRPAGMSSTPEYFLESSVWRIPVFSERRR